MAREWEKRSGSRGHPRAKIDQRLFENLCTIMCTRVEIQQVLEVSERTLAGWCRRTYGKTFTEVFQEKSAKGKASLRRRQFELAQKSAAMAIFLGKNYLGQSDGSQSQMSAHT